jgi:hypothetical protein
MSTDFRDILAVAEGTSHPRSEWDLVVEIVPAYATTLAETMTLTFPEGWRVRIEAVVATGATVYGEHFHRGVVSQLGDMSRCARQGYFSVAEQCLQAAERLAR